MGGQTTALPALLSSAPPPPSAPPASAPSAPQPLSVSDFAAKIRAKNPGAYDDLTDQDLTAKVLAKYPQYSDMVSASDVRQAGLDRTLMNMTRAMSGQPYDNPEDQAQGEKGKEAGFKAAAVDAGIAGGFSARAITPDMAPNPQVTITPDAPALSRNTPPEAQPGGFWHEVVGAIGDMVRGIATSPNIGSPEWTVKTAAAAALADQERKASGRSLPYRAVAGLGENLLGIPASRMEAAAERGDTAGVLGAAAVPTALTVAGPALEGVSKLRAAAKVSGVAEAPKATPTAKPTAEPAPTAGATETKGPAFAGGIAERLGIADPAPESLMTRAVKPLASNNGWDAALKKAMPDMKAAEAKVGPIEGVDDALQATAVGKRALWAQYEDKLNQVKNLGPNAPSLTTIDGNSVADAMMKSIDARTRLQNPGLVEQIQKVAETYRRPFTVQEAEDFLQSANNELHSYYAKNKVGQQVAARDPATGHVVAEAGALRDALYSKLDELTGPGSADLKQRYGALSNVENELLRRKNVAARQQPISLAEQLAMSSGLGDIFQPGKLINRAQNIAVARWLKEYGSADAMITRAFQKFGEKAGSSPAAKPFAVPPLTAVGAPQPEAVNQ